jgi:FMN reductase
MNERAVSLLIVVGSVTPPGRLRGALVDAAARAEAAEVDCLDLAERAISFADGRRPADFGDDTEGTIERIAAADAVVLATPVYRGSMTGALKNLLDQLPVPSLLGKPVGIVAMGASDHHFLGADRHLRDVLAFFGCVVMPASVYLTSADFSDGACGERGASLLDELLGSTAAIARALDGVPRGPAPIGAPGKPGNG